MAEKVDYTRMSVDEKIILVESIFIIHPQFENIINSISKCHQRSKLAVEPRCFFITGDSGSGKSTLAEHYEKKYPRYRTQDGMTIPVLLSKIPSSATEKGMATKILHSLGDPIPDKGSMTSQTLRIEKLIKECSVELIIIDEFQHLIDKDSEKILKSAANWLKDLVTDNKKPMILVGMPWSDCILLANNQLRRRFSARKDLTQFSWKTPEQRQNLRRLLHWIDCKLPFPKRSQLADSDIAFRFICASQGLIGYIMKIIREASGNALQRGCEALTLDLLAEAYDEVISPIDPNEGNPFIMNKKDLEKRTMKPFLEEPVQVERAKRKKNISETLSKR